MRYLALLFMIVSGALLVNPPDAESCGGFPPVAQFGYVYNPGPEFLKGQLGIISPKYYRRNLVVAYRYLSGVPLSAEEAKALEPLPAESSFQALGRKQDPGERWLAARKQVPGAPAVDRIEVFRSELHQGKYRSYWNCLDDAFVTAADTLAARRQRWGAKSPLLAEWLRGQDEVFANCSSRPQRPGTPQAEDHIPGPLPPGADALLEADRQYQDAAAMFYSERLVEAEAAFREIGDNRDSPWRQTGALMVARTLIRRATLDSDNGALAAAGERLDAILRDLAQESLHESARRLRGFVQAQLHPEARMIELGDALSKPGLGAEIRQAMIDYTLLWDRINKGPAESSELADWITAFQNGDNQRLIERWREGAGTQWLVAALVHAQPGDSDTAALIAAARRIDPASPAYSTAAYHGIRLQTALGNRDEARRWTEEALALPLTSDAENAFRGLRMALARDWREFERYAPRRLVARFSFESYDEPARDSDRLLLDSDAILALNVKAPLNLWLEAASSSLLPVGVQTDIAQAGWVRSVILNRDVEARAFAERLAKLRPELAQALSAYLAERSGEAGKFAAVLLMLRNPGLSPVVQQGLPRTTKVDRIDDLRDNWWFLAESSRTWSVRLLFGSGVKFPDLAQYAASAKPSFLTAAQRSQGETQWTALVKAAPVGPDYLCREALAWARAHPEDSRVPEALHLAVRSTRFGLTDDATSDFSRRAFRLLHSRYPKSEWAAKTKYWF